MKCLFPAQNLFCRPDVNLLTSAAILKNAAGDCKNSVGVYTINHADYTNADADSRKDGELPEKLRAVGLLFAAKITKKSMSDDPVSHF